MVVLAETSAEAGVPGSAAHGLTHDAPVAHREPIGGPFDGKLGRRWRDGFGLVVVGLLLLLEKRAGLLEITLLLCSH